MIGDSWDGGSRPPIYWVSTGFSKQGCCSLLRPLISAQEVVPPGFMQIQKGGEGAITTTGP